MRQCFSFRQRDSGGSFVPDFLSDTGAPDLARHNRGDEFPQERVLLQSGECVFNVFVPQSLDDTVEVTSFASTETNATTSF